MSEDPDLPKASYALQVLRQARLSRNETAAIMVEDLVDQTTNTVLRTPEIEEAHQSAWAAISALANALKEEELRFFQRVVHEELISAIGFDEPDRYSP